MNRCTFFGSPFLDVLGVAGGAAVALLVVAVVMPGCSRRFPMAEVSGKVTLDGKPLSDATVMFVPEKGFAAASTLKPDGTFRLISGRPGDGAVIGSHKVAVMPANPLKAHFPAKYQNAETSGFSVEVKAGKNRFEFDLSSADAEKKR